MRRLVHALLALLLATMTGCASVPGESLELSATIGRDLEVVHAAHRTLAALHFDDLLRRIDEFVDDVYRPYVVQRTMVELDVVAELEAALAGTGDLDPLDIMSITVEETVVQIARFRAEMRAPVQRQRREVLAAIDQAHLQLQTANAVVTGHLASVRKVHDMQADALAEAGLEGIRDDMARRLAAVSDGVGRVLEDARQADDGLDQVPARLDQAIEGSR
jgi:hypothetical protein